jgi:hypothetical protein
MQPGARACTQPGDKKGETESLVTDRRTAMYTPAESNGYGSTMQ